MPWGNGTGPHGRGPMTGRAAGFCAGYPAPGYFNTIQKQGFAWGRGPRSGRYRRNWFYRTGHTGWCRAGYGGYPFFTASHAISPDPPFPADISKEDELNELKDQAAYLERTLGNIRHRRAELEPR